MLALGVDKEVKLEAISLLGMLGICTYEDIKNKKIEIFSVMIFGIIGILLHILRMTLGIWDILAGMLIGVFMLVISILSSEKMLGKGDSLMVMISGIYLGFWDNLFLLWGSSFLVGIVGIFMFGFKSKGKSLPFAPFLTVMYIFLLVLKGGPVVL